MATQFKVYRSTDVSAPVLSGTAGALTTLLDACLVNGYGTQVAAGWTIQFTAVNRRVYKQGTGSLVGFRVRDDAGGTALAEEAQVRGAEVWTDVNTVGSGPFPTIAQSALTDNSLVIRKSATADATARAWTCVADAKTCYLITYPNDYATLGPIHCFGDAYSLVPANLYTALLIGRHLENSNVVLNTGSTYNNTSIWTILPGHFSQRNFAGTGGSTGLVKMGSICTTVRGGPASADAALTYPNPPDGGLWLNRTYLTDPLTGGSTTLVGWLRAFWCSSHGYANFTDGDTVSGLGDLSGRSFQYVGGIYGTVTYANPGWWFETSNTVE